MTTIWTYDWEAGVASGTVMTTANSNFKNLVQSGWTFSNAHLLSQGGGSLAGRCQGTGAAVVANDAGRPFANTTNLYYRFYVYVEQLPSATTALIQLWSTNTGTPQSEFRITNTGQAQIRNSSFVAVSTAATGFFGAGTYARIEVNFNNSTQKQQLKVFKDGNVHGTTPDYDSGVVASTSTAGIVTFNFGLVNATTAIIHYDNLAFSNSGWLGPVVAVNQPPTANAGADQTNVEPWTTVTLTGTASDPDGTVASTNWSQTGGTAVTYTVVNANTVTFPAPATINGDTGTHKFTVTDNSGASTNDSVSVTTLPVTERAAINGVETPMRVMSAP